MEDVIGFNKSQYLKDLRLHTLGMRRMIVGQHVANISDKICLTSNQARIQSNLHCNLLLGRLTEEGIEGDPLTEPNFRIYHDGEFFQLKINGEFWGYGSGKYKGIDFNDDGIKHDLENVLNAIRSAFDVFGVAVNSGCNLGHYVGGGDIWWNVTIPFTDHEELIHEDFSQKIRNGLVKVAAAFSTLLKYRIRVDEIDHGNERCQNPESEDVQTMSEDFNALQYLKIFREQTLGMSRKGKLWTIDLSKGCINVTEPYCLVSKDHELGETLRTCLWHGKITENGPTGDFLAELEWKITKQDNRPFLLMSGEFRGTYPAEVYSGIDFSSKDLQQVLEGFAEWFHDHFLIGDEKFGKEFMYDSSHIWWSLKDPLDVFGESFPEILTLEGYYGDIRAEIIYLAEEFVRLLPYRIDKKTGKTIRQKEQRGKKLLQTALDYDFGNNGKNKNPSKAVEYYKKCLAVIDSPLAHYNLALSYLNGDGVKVDKKIGYSHMWKASRLGYASASFHIGCCYENGKDTHVDIVKAAELYRLAADKGHNLAAYKLGMLLKKGQDGIEKNPSEAFRMFGIAAKADEKSVKPEWLYEYARCFFYGLGTEKDPSAGIDMMRRAAESGYAEAQHHMAMAYECGWGVEKSESDRLEWLRKAADNGNIYAEFEYGEWLADAVPDTAIKYLQSAAAKGHFAAQVRLRELESAADEKRITELTEKAERGERAAQYELGMRYLNGDGVTQNANRGFDWLSEAANQGSRKALTEIGWCYLEGIGVPRRNPSRAFDCFDQVVGSKIDSCSNRRALRGLLRCYKNGEGTAQNKRMARSIKNRLDYLALLGEFA